MATEPTPPPPPREPATTTSTTATTPTAAPASSAPDFPLPGILTYPSSSSGATPPAELIAQGAEGRLYRTTYLEAAAAAAAAGGGGRTWAALKHRPAKPWRHPALDARLTRHRILAEARLLARCRRAGVRVPAVYALDEAAGWLMLEWVDGGPVRAAVNAWLARRRGRRPRQRQRQRRRGGEGEEGEEGDGDGDGDGAGAGRESEGEKEEGEGEREDGDEEEDGGEGEREGDEGNEPLVRLMRRIGDAVGRLHKIGVVHGDLTTSNMMLRPWDGGEGRRRRQQQPITADGHATATAATTTTTTEEEGDADDDDDDDGALLDGEIVIIDFGLASVGAADEDRAVDLYVLERAFASTHPRAEGLFPAVLDAYRGAFKQAPVVLRKLEDVRMRGRKRSMLG